MTENRSEEALFIEQSYNGERIYVLILAKGFVYYRKYGHLNLITLVCLTNPRSIYSVLFIPSTMVLGPALFPGQLLQPPHWSPCPHSASCSPRWAPSPSDIAAVVSPLLRSLQRLPTAHGMKSRFLVQAREALHYNAQISFLSLAFSGDLTF